MPISATCPNCGRSYRVKDEHAGKKFRCQECEEMVNVPVPRAAGPEDDWDDDFGQDYEDYEDDAAEDEWQERLPAVPRRVPKKKKPAAKSKPPKKRSSAHSGSAGGAAAAGKIIGGIFVGLVVMSIVMRVIGGLDLGGGSWQSYTTPDGNITVQMPGKVKSVPVKQMAPGGQSYGAERRGFMCVVVIEPMPAEMNGLSEDEIFDAMELGVGFLGATNVQGSTFKGRRCVTFDTALEKGIKSSALAFVHKGTVYTLTYAYKGSKGSNQDKFFNSVQFN